MEGWPSPVIGGVGFREIAAGHSDEQVDAERRAEADALSVDGCPQQRLLDTVSSLVALDEPARTSECLRDAELPIISGCGKPGIEGASGAGCSRFVVVETLQGQNGDIAQGGGIG